MLDDNQCFLIVVAYSLDDDVVFIQRIQRNKRQETLWSSCSGFMKTQHLTQAAESCISCQDFLKGRKISTISNTKTRFVLLRQNTFNRHKRLGVLTWVRSRIEWSNGHGDWSYTGTVWKSYPVSFLERGFNFIRTFRHFVESIVLHDCLISKVGLIITKSILLSFTSILRFLLLVDSSITWIWWLLFGKS
jgi:hypothetical protein